MATELTMDIDFKLFVKETISFALNRLNCRFQCENWIIKREFILLDSDCYEFSLLVLSLSLHKFHLRIGKT